MDDLIAKAEMLIGCSAMEAFQAFAEPERITKFWLKSTTGPLAPDAQVKWEFMVPGAIERVVVTAFTPHDHIAFSWSEGKLNVDLKFSETQSGVTIVSAMVRGFERDNGIGQVVDATEGFSIVLCNLKILLETGRSANLVRDKAELIQCTSP